MHAHPNAITLHELVEQTARTEGCDPVTLSNLVLDSVRVAACETWPRAGGRFEASWGEDGGVELRLYRTIGEDTANGDLDLATAQRCGLDDPADPLQLGDELGLTVFYRAEDAIARERQAAEYGPALQLEQPVGGFGRRAAHAAQRVLVAAVRARQAEIARAAFEPLVGRVVIGRARRHERGALVVDLGGVEARLSAGAGGAGYQPGDRVVALVEAVRGDSVVLTRVGDAFVRALVALEVPAVERGEVEVVRVARETTRAKIAVRIAGDETGEESVEAVERVVGARGVHAMALAVALGGAGGGANGGSWSGGASDLQLDVVPWHPDPVRAAIEALSGVEVVDLEVRGEVGDVLDVRVTQEDVRAAVGARGANARLAAHIGGWRELRVVGERERETFDFASLAVLDVIVLSEEGARRFEELVEMEHPGKLG